MLLSNKNAVEIDFLLLFFEKENVKNDFLSPENRIRSLTIALT